MQPGKESFVEKRKISRFRLIRRDVEQTKDVKKMLAFFKSAFKTAEENNLALYAGSWSFFFILSAVPLVLLLIMACDALGVNVTFLLEDMPRELSDGLKLIFSVAEEASKGATFILVLTSLYSSTRLFSYMLMVNKLAGTPLSDTCETINLNFVNLESAEDAENYYTYVEGDGFPYNEEEIRNMVKYFNPDMTIDELRSIADAYSVDDVMTRHAE